MVKRTGLGRGLGALIDDADIVKEQIIGVAEVEIRLIEANPFQPRTNFDQESLEELAISIREVGLIQPITLRKMENGNYQIITGERRFRAAQMAGLARIPSFIRDVNNDAMLEMAVVENIQREDLNPIEVGMSYQRLIDECNLTQESLANRLGKKRSTVTNYLRLLKLPAIIQKGIIDRELTMGHARALINIEDAATQIMIYEQIKKFGFSVRKVEEIARSLTGKTASEGSAPSERLKYPTHFQPFKEQLDLVLQTQVKLMAGADGKGHVTIPFKSEEELQKIVKIIGRAN